MFNNERNKKDYDRVKKMALEEGFTEEELRIPYLNDLKKTTKSIKIIRKIKLAYYLGWLRGIKYSDERDTKIFLRGNLDVETKKSRENYSF